jgi:hypothetical protein
MKPFAYYAQVPLIPLLFIVAFTLNVCSSVKRSWSGAVWEAKDAWKSHQRHYASKK